MELKEEYGKTDFATSEKYRLENLGGRMKVHACKGKIIINK